MLSESKVPDYSEFTVNYKGFMHCDSKVKAPDEITIEGLHQVFTSKKLMKQAQSDNPLAGRGFKKPVTFSVDREEIRLTQSADGAGADSDLYNTQVSKIVLAKDIDNNVYIIVRRAKQEGKYACHCLSSKSKDGECDRMARYMMHWVRHMGGGGRRRERAETAAAPLRPSAGRHGGALAGAAAVRAPAGQLASVGGAGTPAAAPRPSATTAQAGTRDAITRSMVWYHGAIDRRAAESLLHGAAVGTYLVRFSEKKGEYCLTIVALNRIVQHFVTVTADNGKVSLHGHKNQYNSMIDLIDHYQRFDITSDGDRCIQPLRQ
mmetsp:Transcript_2950/g.8922  ORF Transcript_2950/g.8922 Transcript_2950/m.8922 type:complete len:319 (+) Transcript_2950:96-1052(+)